MQQTRENIGNILPITGLGSDIGKQESVAISRFSNETGCETIEQRDRRLAEMREQRERRLAAASGTQRVRAASKTNVDRSAQIDPEKLPWQEEEEYTVCNASVCVGICLWAFSFI